MTVSGSFSFCRTGGPAFTWHAAGLLLNQSGRMSPENPPAEKERETAGIFPHRLPIAFKA